MMLADLVLSDLPLNVLITLKHAINEEIALRKKQTHIAKIVAIHEKAKSKNVHDIQRCLSYQEAIDDIIYDNVGKLLKIPSGARNASFQQRIAYLPCLLAQNWDHLFPQTLCQEKIFYVYLHTDPRNRGVCEFIGLNVNVAGPPFYVGKGSGTRAYDLRRNQGHGKRITQIRKAGFPDSSIVQIVADNLSELESLTLEAKLIYLLGSIYDEDINGCLLNLADHIKPTFTLTMQTIPYQRGYNKKRHEQECHSPQCPYHRINNHA